MMKQSCIGLLLTTFFLLTISFRLDAQADDRVVIDQVVAVVGNSAILESDIINQQQQLEAQGVNFGNTPKCVILNEVMYQKLLFNQAKLDSVEVSEDNVEMELERRLRYFINQIGSRERLEAYYGKSIDELKEEFRSIVSEQQLSRQMEGIITENILITPSEVRRYFNDLHPDSVPMVESEMVMAELVKMPPVSQEEIDMVRMRLDEFRNRVLKGESFSTLAILYSEDPGSARRGGELGFFERGTMFSEFEGTAFSLRPGEVSEIIETPAGYHIIQMIERRGEQINVRHILLQAKTSPADLASAKEELDSIRSLIMNGEMTFEEAVLKFSDHPSRMNQGLMVSPYTGTNRFRTEEMDPALFFAVDQLEPGGITASLPMTTEEGKQAYRIVKLNSRIDAHKANLQDDYDMIQELALEMKQKQAIDRWIANKLRDTYVFVNEKYRHCDFQHNWIK